MGISTNSLHTFQIVEAVDLMWVSVFFLRNYYIIYSILNTYILCSFIIVLTGKTVIHFRQSLYLCPAGWCQWNPHCFWANNRHRTKDFTIIQQNYWKLNISLRKLHSQTCLGSYLIRRLPGCCLKRIWRQWTQQDIQTRKHLLLYIVEIKKK